MKSNLFVSYWVKPGPNATDFAAVTDAIVKLGKASPTTSMFLFHVSTELSANEASRIVGKAMNNGDKLLNFPRFCRHRLKQLLSLPRTQPVNGSQAWSDDVADCKTLRSIQRCLAWRRLVSGSVDRG